MQLIARYLLLGVMWMGATSLAWTQAPDRGATETPTVRGGSTPESEPKAQTQTTAQLKRSLKTASKRLQKQIAKADWNDDSTLVRIAAKLGTFAADIYAARSSADPTAQALGQNYLDKYSHHLGTYQAKADLGKQQMDPPVDPQKQQWAHAAFTQLVEAHRFLKRTDTLPKRNWGEQEFVDQVKLHIDNTYAAALEYANWDPDNYGQIERYTAVAKGYDAVWNARQELPMQREIAQRFLTMRANPFYVLSKAAPYFEDHAAFLQANEAFEWEEMRRQVVFMNQWEFRPKRDERGAASEIQRWVAGWPSESKLMLTKQISGAKATMLAATDPWAQWQAAARYLALLQSAALIYPSDANYSGSIGEADGLVASKRQAYEATLSSDYHRQNVGGVGLSTTGALGFQPLSSFKAGDKVVLTLFLDRPAEMLNPSGKFELRLEGIADQAETIAFQVAAADMRKNYIDIALLSDKAYAPDTRMAEEGILGALCLAEGRVVKLTLTSKLSAQGQVTWGTPSQVTFDGSLAAGIAAYRTRWTALRAAH